MAAEPAADPWSAPNSDPWASGGWTDGTSANAAAESEPNADYSANALTADGPQSRENQDSPKKIISSNTTQQSIIFPMAY